MGVIVIGADELAAKFERDAAQIEALKPVWLNDVGEMVKVAIQGNILKQGLDRSGDLLYSGRVFNQTSNGVSVGFGNMLGYAEPLELGAAPHEILGNPYLAFYWSGQVKTGGYYGWHKSSGDGVDNQVVVTRVHHPGNIAYRFVYNGTLESFTPILMYFNRMVGAVLGGLPID